MGVRTGFNHHQDFKRGEKPQHCGPSAGSCQGKGRPNFFISCLFCEPAEALELPDCANSFILTPPHFKGRLADEWVLFPSPRLFPSHFFEVAERNLWEHTLRVRRTVNKNGRMQDVRQPPHSSKKGTDNVLSR